MKRHFVYEKKTKKTLMNMVRNMIVGRNALKIFWLKEVIWATYVWNASPILSVKNITNLKPLVHPFRVFGCLAYAHIFDVQTKKLDLKGI